MSEETKAPDAVPEELLPCPFCGSVARWAASAEADGWEIQCSKMDCPLLFIGGDDTGRELEAVWNTRSDAALTESDRKLADMEAENVNLRQQIAQDLTNATANAQEKLVLREAMIRLRDCDWVITPADRMDAVRQIAREAIEKQEAISAARQTGGAL